MKKVLFRLSALVILLVATSSFSFAQYGGGNGNNSPLVGRAIGEFNSHGCGGPSVGPVNGVEETLGICFVSGFITRVLIYPQINCQQVDCNAIRIAPIGYVDFGCGGEVIGVSCTWP
jgi:hypothetical protein